MRIEQSFIQPNQYTRGGRPMAPPQPGISALVVHWTANPKQSARGVLRYWNGDAITDGRYGSTHAIADDEVLYQAMPYEERAYHVGSSRGYSSYAVERFGELATSSHSPNKHCWGIEMCVEDAEGSSTPATWETTVAWLAMQAGAMQLDPFRDILTHQQIVGWKACPKWMVDHPDELERLRLEVARRI